MTTYFPSRSPSGLQFLDPHEAHRFWREHAPSTYGGRCETIGDGRVYCQGITVAPLHQKFELVVVVYERNPAAGKAFHRVCDAPRWAGWSMIIWDAGQNWYGVVTSRKQEMPPEEVANAIADVLESSAHGGDCSSV